jgi:calcineurin-like phosphoesterase family protein
MIFFTSDLHIGHARIIELCNRPFSSIEEMNKEIVRRWNDRVTPSDVVWVLGDVALGPIQDSLSVVTELNGIKHLVPGNHDRCFSGYRKGGPRAQDFEMYSNVGFTVETEQVSLLNFSERGTEIWSLSHFPYFGDTHRDIIPEQNRPKDDGKILLHGHTHSSLQIRNQQVHVGVDAWDYRPVSIDEVVELLNEEGNE